MPLETEDRVAVCILVFVVEGWTVMTVVSCSSAESLDADEEGELVTAVGVLTAADEGPEEAPPEVTLPAAEDDLEFAADETPEVTAPLLPPPELCPTIAPVPHGVALPSGCVDCGAGTC